MRINTYSVFKKAVLSGFHVLFLAESSLIIHTAALKKPDEPRVIHVIFCDESGQLLSYTYNIKLVIMLSEFVV